MVDKAKELLTRQIGPFPVYAYVVGLVALVGGVLYFRAKANTGAATAAPQTNYPADNIPLPYPDPGSGAGVPPSAAFDTSGQGVVQGTGAYIQAQSNFVPPQPQPTSSQTFAASTGGIGTGFDRGTSYVPTSGTGTSGIRSTGATAVQPISGFAGIGRAIVNAVQTVTAPVTASLSGRRGGNIA